MIAELREVIEECSAPGWDGYGAEAIDPASASMAELLVEALPEMIGPPAFGVDPDGEVTIEWCASSDRSLSLSVGAGGEISFAWKLGDKGGCGLDFLEEDGIHGFLLVAIRPFRA